MKKFLTFLLALTMAFVLVSCDEEYVEDYETDDTVYEEADEAEDTAEPTDSDVQTFDTVTDFLDVSMELFELPADDPQREYVSLEVYEAEGSMVFAFTYIVPMADLNVTVADLEAPNEEVNAYYSSVYTSVKEYVPSLQSVAIEYYNVDGEFLTAKEFY